MWLYMSKSDMDYERFIFAYENILIHFFYQKISKIINMIIKNQSQKKLLYFLY